MAEVNCRSIIQCGAGLGWGGVVWRAVGGGVGGGSCSKGWFSLATEAEENLMH